MKLPIFKLGSKLSTVSGTFNGIAENSLADVVNLICSGDCRTRNTRKEVMVLSTSPDQVITCENRLFLRYGNLLKEVIMDIDGILKERTQNYELSDLDPSTDRKLIGFDGKLFVFPDKIQIGWDKWVSFAPNLSISAALPFTNARTLFYPENAEAENFCDDALTLKVGMKLRFSWALEDFTVKTVEDYMEATDDGSGFVKKGRRITLDCDVPNFAAPPTNGVVKVCDPQNRPILDDLTVGFNHRVTFSGNRIIIQSEEAPYEIPLSEFFKVGQTVEISGSSAYENDVIAKIIDIKDNSLYLNHTFKAVKEASKTEITINPLIPEFSHFLITEDRLFGVDNEEGKFYISALKKPFLFYDDWTQPEDSWSMNINEFATGITLWKDNIICFTESGGFRILGYHANNFGVRQLSVNGIKKGCEASLCRVGNTLYYCSKKGVMSYSGGKDKKISKSAMQMTSVQSAVTDGTFVYMLEGDRIWVYDTNTDQCWSENGGDVLQIFIFNSERYLFLGKRILLADGKAEENVFWNFELHGLPDKNFKKVQPISFTINHSENTDSSFVLYYRSFGVPIWQRCGIYNIKGEGIIEIPLPKGYCNGFRLRAEGNGNLVSEGWRIAYRIPK